MRRRQNEQTSAMVVTVPPTVTYLGPRYEYVVEELNADVLNDYGAHGWRVVGTDAGLVLLERELEPATWQPPAPLPE